MSDYIFQQEDSRSIAILSDVQNLSKEETRIIFLMEKAGLISMFKAIKTYLDKDGSRLDFAAAIAEQLIKKVKGESTGLIKTLVEKPDPSLKPLLVMSFDIMQRGLIGQDKMSADAVVQKQIQSLATIGAEKIQMALGNSLSEREMINELAKVSGSLSYRCQFYKDAENFYDQANNIIPLDDKSLAKLKLSKEFVKMDAAGKLLRFVHDGIDEEEKAQLKEVMSLIDTVQGNFTIDELEKLAKTSVEKTIVYCFKIHAYDFVTMFLEEMYGKTPEKWHFMACTLVCLMGISDNIKDGLLIKVANDEIETDKDLEEYVRYAAKATRYGNIGMNFPTDAFEEFEKFGKELKLRSKKISNSESMKIFRMSEL